MRPRSSRSSIVLTLMAALALFALLALSPSDGSASNRVRRGRYRPGPPGGVYARNAVAIDPQTGTTLFEKDPGAEVPIASLTKLMTALVLLEQHPDLDQVVEITLDDRHGAGHTHLTRREHVRIGDLLRMSLMISDNAATRALARGSGLPLDDFVGRMNGRASELGLAHTRFVDPAGLDPGNVSTAVEVAALLRRIMTTREYHFVSASRRSHDLSNTNRMVYDRYEVVGGKTGHIGAAGFCVATWLRDDGRDLIAVVLGAPNSPTRFNDVRRIVRQVAARSAADVGR
jgi:D-alanyl-D-alanine endopeptidase (penicillin-binding protein 7)